MAQLARNVVRLNTGLHSADKDERIAFIILAAIKREIGGAEYFTREDLLHLSVLQHIATITRYHVACQAVRHLVGVGELMVVTRTELCLPSMYDRIVWQPVTHVYEDTLNRLIQERLQINREEPFGVMDVVQLWKTDPHLTLNTKRAAVRQALRTMQRHRKLIAHDDFSYRGTKDAL